MTEWSEKEREGIDRLKELVEAYSAECRNREKGWINVVQSLPRMGENVLVHSINRENPPKQDIWIGNCTTGIWYDYNGDELEDREWHITHWMPFENILPEVE